MRRLGRILYFTTLLLGSFVVHSMAKDRSRFQVSKPQIKMPNPGTGGTAAYVEVKAWVEGPEDEATWCIGATFAWPGGTTSTVEQDCPSWPDHLREVSREIACDDAVFVVPPGQVAMPLPCPVAFRQDRSWKMARWFGVGTNVVKITLHRGEQQLARLEALVIVPGMDRW